MKNRIVVWGTNGQDERILIALELKADQNKVNLTTFPQAIVSDDFVKKMMDEWRSGTDLEFPEGHATSVRELSAIENLLPDDLKVERGDVISRAQSEWQFTVLSHKMSQAYQQELADLKEKVASLTNYDNKMWDGLKQFWDKVSEQVRDRNLFREHADNLRDGTNELFEQLKGMRSKADVEFKSTSASLLADLNAALDSVEAKIESGGARFASVFDDLKALQSKYRTSKMTREDGDKIWNRLDAAFKNAKEKRFGPAANEGSLSERHERRLAGLVDAIKKMQFSIDRDAEELSFQEKKIKNSEGQLEAQIRTAKIRMVKERIDSKQEKLDEMKKTRGEVEAQIAQAKSRDSKKAEKDTERAKIDAAKAAAREKFDAQAKASAAGLAAEPAAKMVAEPIIETVEAIEEPAVEVPKTESIFSAIGSVLSEAMEDLGDTVKAVAEVVGEKAEVAFNEVSAKAEVAFNDAAEKAEKMVEVLKEEKKSTREKAAETSEEA